MASYRGWGNAINFDGHTTDGTQYRWHGHTTPLPRVGDIFDAPLKAGGTAPFTVTEVKPCYDPGDMWFAKTAAQPDGYLPKRSANPLGEFMQRFNEQVAKPWAEGLAKRFQALAQAINDGQKRQHDNPT